MLAVVVRFHCKCKNALDLWASTVSGYIAEDMKFNVGSFDRIQLVLREIDRQ